VHQPIRQLSIRRKKEQSGTIDVQPSDSDPATVPEVRKALEHCRTSLRVGATDDLAFRFVVGDDAPRLTVTESEPQQLTAEMNSVSWAYAITERSDPAVDPNAALPYPFLDLTPRA